MIAIAGLAAAVIGGVGSFLLARSGGETTPVASAAVLQQRAAAARQATPAKAAPATKPTPKAAKAAKAAQAKPAAKAAPEAKEPKPTVAPNGFPLSLAAALNRHEVVVVSLATPGGRVDELALAEARAGAAAAGTGFVALNSLDELQGGALARLIGVRKTPVLLVYSNPDTLALTIDGYVDAATVAQAAQNAAP